MPYPFKQKTKKEIKKDAETKPRKSEQSTNNPKNELCKLQHNIQEVRWSDDWQEVEPMD